MKARELAGVFVLLLSGASSVVINDQLGHVQILYENDLLSNTTSTSALLIQSEKCYPDAVAACNTLSESLLARVPPDVQHQLDYLVYSGQLHQSAKLYISPQATRSRVRALGGNESCLAYDVTEHKVSEVDCNTPLRVLCTQSAAPYSASQLNSTITENRRTTVNSQNYAITG